MTRPEFSRADLFFISDYLGFKAPLDLRHTSVERRAEIFCSPRITELPTVEDFLENLCFLTKYYYGTTDYD